MVSSVTGSAAFSTAMLSGSQCRGTSDAQALQEKLFSKLDVNGDGGIDQSELTQFVDFASSSLTGTGSASDTTGADLFTSMDTDGDGTLSKTELADGAKKLFDELRTQLMTAGRGTAASAEAASSDAAGSESASTDATAASAQSADEPRGPPPPPPGGRHHDGGMFARIASLLDQYRSTATDTTAATAETTTLSVAA